MVIYTIFNFFRITSLQKKDPSDRLHNVHIGLVGHDLSALGCACLYTFFKCSAETCVYICVVDKLE
jgi:hypothetical protein